MKKIAWNALITLLFTLAAIQSARALAEEPPALPRISGQNLCGF